MLFRTLSACANTPLVPLTPPKANHGHETLSDVDQRNTIPLPRRDASLLEELLKVTVVAVPDGFAALATAPESYCDIVAVHGADQPKNVGLKRDVEVRDVQRCARIPMQHQSGIVLRQWRHRVKIVAVAAHLATRPCNF